MLGVHKKKDGFDLLFKGTVVAGHTRRRPLFELGRGEAEYRMRHGSFKIKDRLMARIDALGSYDLEEEEGQVRIKGALADISCCVAEGRLEFTFQPHRDDFNRAWFRPAAVEGEYIFGGGEQYSAVNLAGRTVPVWCREQGVGRGRDLITLLAELTHGSGGAWHTTYFPQPTFLSSRNWFCHIEGSAYMECSFRPGDYEIHCFEVPAKIIFSRQDSPAALLADLTALLGRQPPLPDWVNDGVWLGLQGGREVVERKLNAALEAGVKVAALWCQDWVGSRLTSFGKQLMWDWRYDRELYPDLPAFAGDLAAEGVRFLGYINPFLALEGELYREAAEKGYTVQKPGGGEYHVSVTDFPVAMLDLTNEEAVRWIKQVIVDNMIGTGLSGWMADFGEYLPVDALLHSGESAELYHNRYPVKWARVNREAVVEAGREEEVTFFCRAGYSGVSAHAPLFWAGDQLVNWSLDDGLASVIPAALSAGLSGIGHFHSDIGGYTTVAWIKRSRELFMRWAEMSAFSAVMRTHEGNRPAVNYQFDSDREGLLHFARMSRVHAHLKPYIREALKQYQKSGLPLIRHLWLHYPHDRAALALKYQYLFGRDLLVAPVYRRGCRKLSLYLPDERWTHLFSGQKYRGGRHLVEAPLGEPAVFYRAESPWRDLFAALKDAVKTP